MCVYLKGELPLSLDANEPGDPREKGSMQELLRSGLRTRIPLLLAHSIDQRKPKGQLRFTGWEIQCVSSWEELHRRTTEDVGKGRGEKSGLLFAINLSWGKKIRIFKR